MAPRLLPMRSCQALCRVSFPSTHHAAPVVVASICSLCLRVAFFLDYELLRINMAAHRESQAK